MQNILTKLILASIFIVPFSSIIAMPGTIIWYPQFLSVISIGFIFLALMFWKKNKFISILLIYEIFSYVFVSPQSPRTLICLVCAFTAMAVFYAASEIKNTIWAFRCLLIFAGIQFIYAIFQFFGMDFFFKVLDGSHRTDVVGFMGSHNQFGAFYAVVSIVSMFINPVLSLFSIAAIGMARCTSAMAGLFCGIFVYYFFMNNKRAMVILSIAALIGIPCLFKFSGKTFELQERMNLWKLTIAQTVSGKMLLNYAPVKQIDFNHPQQPIYKKVSSNPLFGYGLGNFFVFSPYSQYVFLTGTGQGHRYEHAHNDLIEAFFEFGWIGLGIILLCIGIIIIDFFNAYHSLWPDVKNLIICFSSLVAMAVSSMGIYIFHAPVSLFMFSLMLGLFYREVNNANKGTIGKIAAETFERRETQRRDDGRGDLQTGFVDEISERNVFV